MKRIILYFLPLLLLVACHSNTEKHFLTDESYRNQVHEQFLKRKELAKNRQEALFSILDKDSLSLEQKEALEFLYAYMPLCDLADLNGEFFLNQVNAAFQARNYFSWGKTIPEDIFRHFVLVYRVNNENMDDARTVFFDELKDRVKGMTMGEAALEVNHWCHEKVTYRGTDGRTSAPLALVKTSWGRCGEESTFTATALRAVGIPARQCYTPRWAHTDDNHAWVEVWIDGQWHYIGACEPEAELDVAWFTAPAKRAMMVHTNVFGQYNGPEEKNLETPLYSKINLLANYATTKRLNVSVQDERGKPVENATVRFKLYNYAQLYPIAEAKTDKDGGTSIVTGLGDLVVWADANDRFGYSKAAAKDENVLITLDRKVGDSYDESMELVPPGEQKIKEVDAGKQAENARRFTLEDSVRNAYMGTFMNEEQAALLAKEINLDKTQVWKYIQLSQGNWEEMASFMKERKDNSYLFPFLASLSEKDLRDTPGSYLKDFLKVQEINLSSKFTTDFIAKYILSPRIGTELIRPWNSILKSAFGENAQFTALDIIRWMKENVRILDNENYYNCSLTPIGVYELRVADARSRDIAFVAGCRAFGIPARLEPASGEPQYFENEVWVNALFGSAAPEKTAKATLAFTNNPANLIKPQYEIHYTIARFENGDFTPLGYYDDPALEKYPAIISVDTGYYRLMVGCRANDGSVTTTTSYFDLKADQKKNLDIKLPEVQGKLQVLGIVDMNTIVNLADGTKKTLKDFSKGKGVMLCFVDPDKEPSKHVLQDLPALKSEFESWGGGVVMMTPDDKLSKAFDASVFKNLPGQTMWTIDPNRVLLNTVTETLQLDFRNDFPLTLLLSNNGGILFFSKGYRIGIGENVIKTVQLQK